MSNLRTLRKRKLRERQKQRNAVLEQLSQMDLISDEEQNRIINMTATEVVDDMKTGKISAETVMVCMVLQAMRAGIDLNATAEELFTDALAKARDADALRKEIVARGQDPRRMLPLLHGLPVSIKDQINQKGQVSTCGLVSRAFEVMEDDSPLVSMLIAAGAIPFVRSNIPQLLMLPESYNHLWGRALNPWKLDRSPGGSSGGEAALVASRGSFLGIGTDIGGSIRIPSHFSGVHGFKPTPERVTQCGISSPRTGNIGGQPLVRAAAGPLARSVDDLELVMQVWFSKDAIQYKKDPYTPPVYWKSISSAPSITSAAKVSTNELKKKIRVGYFYSDGWVGSAASCKRALDEAITSIKAKFGNQYEFFPFQVPDPEEAVLCYCSNLHADGQMKSAREDLRGEEMLDEYKIQYLYARIPKFLRPIIGWLMSMFGEKRKAKFANELVSRSTYEYFQLNKRIKMYRKKFLKSMEEQNNIDVLMLPGGTLPAFPNGKSGEIVVSLSLTYLFNLLHFPAGTVPVTMVNKKEETQFTEIASDSLSRDMRDTLIGTAGLPLGVQIAARPFQDELVVKVMRDLDAAINFHGKYKPDIAKKSLSIEALRAKL